MSYPFLRTCASLFITLLLLQGDSAFAQRRFDQSGSPSKNNSKILDLFKQVVATTAESTVAVLVDGKQVALGAVVKADGFILTKDSELKNDNISVKFKDGTELEARKIANIESWDLAMLKVDAKDLKPVTWEDSKIAPVGNWVATAAPTERPVAIGVVSVASRRIPERGYLGIQMKDNEDGEGVQITSISPKSPAEKVGLKEKDIIVAVDGKDTPDAEALGNNVGRHQPGETVTVRYRRNGLEKEIKVTLGKRPIFGPDRGDLQNSMGTDRSERRTGFPVTLQHDTDLKASQCGGPLVDIDGRVIGINIARGGRTDTYAIPAEAIKPLLNDMIAANTAVVNVKLSALVEKIKSAEVAVNEAEAMKTAAEKKLAEAKAALEKLRAEQRKETEKQ